MAKTLYETFKETAQKAQKAFPDRLRNLFIISMPRQEPIYITPGTAQVLTENISEIRKYLESLGPATAWTHTNHPVGGIRVNLVALFENVRQAPVTPGLTSAMFQTYVLDHEIGHMVADNGIPSVTTSAHLAECTADAFAALRHIQRFGTETDFFKYSRASALVLASSPKHYTDDTMMRVQQVSRERSIKRLSLKETAALASQIARESCLKAEQMQHLRMIFAPVASLHGDEVAKAKILNRNLDWEKIFKKIVEIEHRHANDAAVVKTARRFRAWHKFGKTPQAARNRAK